jgi:hypothetical protein
MTVVPFNPLDKKNLGASVAEAMLRGKSHALDDLPRFIGAGIYAIYYAGAHPAYTLLSQVNRSGDKVPIYVGKAVPPGARMGARLDATTTTRALFNRLSEHADSIRSTADLNVSDFRCKYLVVDDIWIPLGESLLIAKFSPVWNSAIDGFGNHDPGAGRYQGMMPRWDVLHPGRPWAAKCQPRQESTAQLRMTVETYLANNPMPDLI